ncbi:MAG: hypothetical protein BYD32DRAFT_462613 [Podila humilis]|nr:MAG: hypothetical protein BYD32DRAFT_462613 [Podila humilis]
MTDGPTLTSSSVVQNGLDKMQDARTMDIAFVFTHSPGVRVALWAHQLMLAMSSNRFRNLYAVDRFNNLHRIATNHNESLSSARVYEICTYSLKELSIEAYCALVRYLYTSVLEFKVDMREFVLTHYPVDSPDQYLKRPECSREMNKLMKELLDQPDMTWLNHGRGEIVNGDSVNHRILVTVTSELNMSSPVQYTLTDMKDMATLDFAFVFKQPTIHSQVAIWTHQDVLASSIQLANYFMTPNKVYGRSGPRRYSISFVRVSYCLLESYCAMIRFLYSGQLALEIDLREFVLTSTAILSPDKQLLVRSAVVEGTLVKPLRETTWDDVYKLAMGFEMKSLKARCLEKV